MVNSRTDGMIKDILLVLRSYGIGSAEIKAMLHEDDALSKVFITKSYRILLGEERKEVHMEPLVKAVFLLFLNHPEGIIFKYLPDYREELTKIYDKVRPWGLTDRTLQSIEDVTNPLLNSINEKCARIKKAFLGVMEGDMAEQYYIKGSRGERKGIALPRDLVVWE